MNVLSCKLRRTKKKHKEKLLNDIDKMREENNALQGIPQQLKVTSKEVE